MKAEMKKMKMNKCDERVRYSIRVKSGREREKEREREREREREINRNW